MAIIVPEYVLQGVPVELPPDNLPETDEVPLESNWHRAAIALLIESVVWHFRGRTDFFAGGNMFIYYSKEQSRTRDYRGPDFFFVKGVKGPRPRPYWAVWDEDGLYPHVIIELLSPSTATLDRTTKKDLYEQTFRTPDYFCYDPDTRRLEGWHLGNSYYEPLVPNERGWLWSKQLGLWVGTWEGQYLNETAAWPRFYDPQGLLVLTAAEDGTRRAEQEHQRAEQERHRAEQERQRAEQERQRAEALEAEVARLRALLGEQAKPSPPPGS